MRHTKLAALTIAMVFVFIFSLLVSCTSPAVPAEPKAIKVGFIMPLTGPAAEKGQPIGQGELDAIKYINDELGGVNGIKIDAEYLDSKYDSAQATTNAKKFMADGCAFFTAVSSKEAVASQKVSNDNGFPCLVVFSSPALTHPPAHMYAQLPDYGDDWAAFTKYYLQNIWKGPGKPKMALAILNNPTGYGVRDAARAAAADLGVDIVATEEHTATTMSETDALTRIQTKNPDVLFISSTPAPTSVILKNAYELKMIPGITIGCAHASFTKALVDLAGPTVSEGVFGVFPTVNWGDNVPGMAKMTEYAKARHPEFIGNGDYITGWASSLINAEIIRQTLKTTDLKVLTGGNAAAWTAAENQGFLQVKSYDVEGLQGPVDFSNPLDKRGSKSVKLFQVQKGQIISLTGWIDAPLIQYEKYDWFK